MVAEEEGGLIPEELQLEGLLVLVLLPLDAMDILELNCTLCSAVSTPNLRMVFPKKGGRYFLIVMILGVYCRKKISDSLNGQTQYGTTSDIT